MCDAQHAMTTQQPTTAPDRFLRRLRKAMAGQPLSLRSVAKEAGISPGYLSRLIKGERGLPEDDAIITRLELILEIPRGELFDAADRPDKTTKTFLKKTQARPLMRTLEHLNEAEMAQVLAVAERFAAKYHPGEK
jgi:transcriptional regulator with XRE-family HTH domain